MRCIPCRVTYDGKRYEIFANGNVFPVLRAQEAGTVVPAHGPQEPEEFAKLVRADAARQRRNRNAREKHDALTSLGLKRVRGAQGGIYYE